MAKVIRQCWVWKPHYRWHVYLPRRNDGLREYDFEANGATPSTFSERIPEEPPKLWLVWFYRDLAGEPRWTKERVRRLFGGDPTPGDMHVFKNTADINKQLWHMKHLIELRPMRFPNGEPTEADINHLEVMPDGQCIIDQKASVDVDAVRLADPAKQFTPGYLASRLRIRDKVSKDVYEDTVYNPANISVVD